MKPIPIAPFIFTTDAKAGADWAYTLTQSMQWRILGRNFPPMEIHHGYYKIGMVAGNVLTVYAGYAWNGMSCWPDSPTSIMPSRWHDFWYQVGRVLTRQQADEGLEHLLRLKNDSTPRLCYCGVRLFGWKFYGKEKGVTLRRL
jgi:hypothetical protein